jgi:serine/threonine protein kinase
MSSQPPNKPEDNSPVAAPLTGGTVLQNRYLIERLLGGGGMGMVYLARDQRLSSRPCAIKEMVDHFIDPQQRLEANEYFAREADTLAQLKHPAIPAITDRFDDQNRHYLVMEYVEGRNLEEEIAVNGGPLAEGLVIDIGRQLCDVLAYLHGFTPPVVYRDMKPSNVMLTPKGRAVLIDFGIARLFRAARKGTMIGTLGFAPPEQYQGLADPRSDIYSLAATLHYILTGRDPEKFPPFSFPPVRELRPEVSGNLASSIDMALAYQLEDRPQSVHELRDMMLYGRGVAATARVSSRSGTAGIAPPPIPADDIVPVHRRPKSAFARAARMAVFSLLLGSVAFGATYIYSSPVLQMQLGIKPLIDKLPWRHEELLATGREHPLDFDRMTLQLSTREGSPLSPPKASFTDAELSNARYLKWDATFANRLTGLEGRSDKVEARFFDPNGLQVASTDVERFVGPGEKMVDFSGVALVPDLSDRPRGDYKVSLTLADQTLAEQRFSITEDLASKARAAEAKAAAEEAVRETERKSAAAEKRLAMIEERKQKPLQLLDIHFVNSTKTGTPISSPTGTFDAAKVLFVDWEVSFQNRLYNLDSNQYRIDAAYVAPDGRTLGSVYDTRMVPQSLRQVTFSGRVGNSGGGAFVPGTYTVTFYLNGQYLADRKFRVASADTLGGEPASAVAPGAAAISLDTPTLAAGNISGLAGKSSIPIELRLRPQPNGFLHGELVIHETGYGLTPIEGYVRGTHLSFQVPYRGETLYFEGEQNGGGLQGTFEGTPSGEHGSWTARPS